MKTLGVKALRSWRFQLVALAVVALAVAGCRSAADAWKPRELPWEQAELELARVLRYAASASGAEEIAIAGRDIWAIAADAALTAHPECASVVGSGRSSYPRGGMEVLEGLDDDSPLPANIDEWYFPRLYGEPSRAYIDKRRIVLLWLRLDAPRDVAAVAVEYIPESDGSEVRWRRTAEVRVAYCYDADGEELANFDRVSLPPLNLANLGDSSLSDEVNIRVRQPGELLCAAEVTADFDVEGLDDNAPEYSGAAPGSDPTPEMWQALEDQRETPDDFEVWYVVGPRRVLFASIDDRERDPTIVGQYADVLWLGFNAEGVAVWGVDTAGSVYRCEEEEE